jgi:hypothetical protein
MAFELTYGSPYTPVRWNIDDFLADMRELETDKFTRRVIQGNPALAPLSVLEWNDFKLVSSEHKGLTPRMELVLEAALALVMSHPSMKTNRARGLIFSTIFCDDMSTHCCRDKHEFEVLFVPHKDKSGLSDNVTDISFMWSPDCQSDRHPTNLTPSMLLKVAEKCKPRDPDGTAEYTRGAYRIHVDVADVLDAIFELSHPPTRLEWCGEFSQAGDSGVEKWIRRSYDNCANKVVAFVYAEDIEAEAKQAKEKMTRFFNTL